MGELSRLSSLLGFLKDRALPSTPTTDSIADVLRAVEKRAMVTTLADSLAHALGLRGDAASATGSVHAKVKDIKNNMSLRPAAATYFASVLGDVSATGTVILDTGALAAGEYEVICQANEEPSSDTMSLQHRNALNDANIRSVAIFEGAGSTPASETFGFIWLPRVTVATDERFRVLSQSVTPKNAYLFVRTV